MERIEPYRTLWYFLICFYFIHPSFALYISKQLNNGVIEKQNLFFFFLSLSHPGTFYKQVIDKCQSFNQLVYHQNEIVLSLKTHLQIKNSFAYQPLLE